MQWTPTDNHSPLNNGGSDLPHAQSTRMQMGVPHPYPNFSNNDAAQPGNNGYSPNTNLAEGTGTSKTV